MSTNESFTFRQFRHSDVQFSSTEYDKVLEANLIEFANAYTSNIVEDAYNSNANEIGWHCFECKKPISVDVSGLMQERYFDTKDLYCTEHRPPDHALAYKNNYIFQRYLVSFRQYLKQIIIKNSKLTSINLWKELQGLESMSPLTQPESRSLFRKRKRQTKKLSTFKSALATQQSQHQ